jgi:putative ubiquitin-RnfH superfamily antitoxin RatB of RatAB toxin-antitoxin module
MATIRVEVVYALAGREDSSRVTLPAGATVTEAIGASGIAARHPGIDLRRLGIFGKTVAADARLADGDRVEIYRPLALDPKEARRRRAKRI